MSGIMSMFSNIMGSGNSATPAAANPAPTPGNIPEGTPAAGNSSTKTAANGAVPQNPEGTPATPLDQFGELWKNETTDGANKPSGVFGEIDPKKFMEAAGKIDFTKVVTPENLQAISAGGEGAVKAFAEAMNAVAQSTYAQSAFAATKITEQAMARAKESFLAELPQHIKKQNVSDSLRTENPVFSNPAVQPIISALESQLAVKYPNATASELTSMAKSYVEALGTAFTPAKPEPEKKGSNETDWEAFLS